MEINSIPDIFQSKIRIAIVSCLMTGEKTFKEIKDLTAATDGNLSVHLTKLEEGSYISARKDFFNNKPRTRYNLTEMGRNEFVAYVNVLKNILSQYSKGTP